MMDSTTEVEIFLAIPEIVAVICIPIPPARKWLLKLIEDSDGDPHHTDGFFLGCLWCGTLCIRIAALITFYDLVHHQDNLGYVVAFLSYGTALLGVRIASNMMSFNSASKTKGTNGDKEKKEKLTDLNE